MRRSASQVALNRYCTHAMHHPVSMFIPYRRNRAFATENVMMFLSELSVPIILQAMGDNNVAEKKTRNSYSLEKKLHCIATAKRLNNIDRAAELEGVPRSCLVKWMDDEKKFKDARYDSG